MGDFETERQHAAGVPVGAVAGAHGAGVQRVGGHARVRRPPGELGGEEDVRQLRLRVHTHAPVAHLGRLEVVEGDPLPAAEYAADATLTTRAGADARSRSSSRLVRRNGPRWLVAKVASNPSTVSLRSLEDETGVVDEHVEAGRELEDLLCAARGPKPGRPGRTRPTASWLEPSKRVASSARAARPLSALRAVTSTRAPAAASAAAVS